MMTKLVRSILALEEIEEKYHLEKRKILTALEDHLTKNQGEITQKVIGFYYWETDLSLEFIAKLLNTSASGVKHKASKDYTINLKCHRCGEYAPYKPTSRTDLREMRKKHNPRAFYCPACEWILAKKQKEHDEINHKIWQDRNYRNRGEEDYTDVIVLCHDCHTKFHDKLATQ